jgi:tetratricopeptide (TPR) repeat protein
MIHDRALTRWLAVFALSVVAGCGGAHSRYLSHLDRGKHLLADDQLDKAGIEFRNALQIEPRSAEALFLSGQVAERRGNLRSAVAQYQRAVDIDPEYTAPRASLARVYVLAGDPNRAMTLIGPGLDKHPNDPDLLTVRAAARAQLKDAAGAHTDAERALRLGPQNEVAVALLAALYRNGGDPERAIKLVANALTRLPHSTDLHAVLANLYIEVKQPQDAEQQLREIVKLRPQELAPRYQLALFYASSQRLDDAERVLTEAVKVRPDSNEAKLALVDFVSTQRSKEAGEKTLRDFVAANPRNYDLQLALGALLLRNGATQDAVKVYQEIVARSGSDPTALAARDEIAAIDSRQGNYDAAGKLIEEVLRTNPRDNTALVLRADIEMQRKNPAAAIADLRNVLRDQPQAVPVRRALARAFIANGEPALAEEMLRAAMDAAPTDADLRIQLAQLLLQTDRTEQAIPVMEEAVRRAPTYVPAREQLVRCYMTKQDWTAARIAVEDLKTLQPKMALGFYLSGLVAQSQHRLQDSEREYEHALELQPDATDALWALAALQLSQGRAADAIARVEQVVERDPHDARALDLLGELYTATHAFPQAYQVLSRASQAWPSWWLPYHDLASAYVAAKDPERAVAVYLDGIKAAADPARLTFELASFYEKQGRVDDAIALCESLHRRNPSLASAANNLAMLLVTYKKDQGSLDRARDLTASFVSTENGSLLDANGWVRYKRGEYDEALRVLQHAARVAPDSRVVRYHLGMVELRQGQREQARSDLEMALSGSISFAGSEDARIVLAGLKHGTG